jgi:hypothetical protein
MIYRIIFFLVLTIPSYATTIYFNPVDGLGIPLSEGDWNNNANWSYTENGTSCNCTPVSGDTIIIPTSKKVNINANVDLTSGICRETVVHVYGEMFFEQGRKLYIGCSSGTCNSNITIHNGGSIVPEKTSGKNNQIEICGDQIWYSSLGTIGGYRILSTIALPVELVSINSEVSNKSISISWITASEINNDFFEVEHSSNGIDFKFIGYVDGNGNSNKTINYNFLHDNPDLGINYYRVKQQDYNGDYSYSPLTKVSYNNTLDKGFKVYPNPLQAGDIINVENIFSDDSDKQIYIYNSASRLVYNNELSNDKMNQIKLPSDILPKGIYFLVLTNGAEKYSEKLIIK